MISLSRSPTCPLPLILSIVAPPQSPSISLLPHPLNLPSSLFRLIPSPFPPFLSPISVPALSAMIPPSSQSLSTPFPTPSVLIPSPFPPFLSPILVPPSLHCLLNLSQPPSPSLPLTFLSLQSILPSFSLPNLGTSLSALIPSPLFRSPQPYLCTVCYKGPASNRLSHPEHMLTCSKCKGSGKQLLSELAWKVGTLTSPKSIQ